MLLGKIIGTLVANRKDEKIEGFKFMIVRELNVSLEETDGYVVAADSVGAGLDEIVLYATGSSARQTELTDQKPCDAVIMAIVDEIVMRGEKIWEKHDPGIRIIEKYGG